MLIDKLSRNFSRIVHPPVLFRTGHSRRTSGPSEAPICTFGTGGLHKCQSVNIWSKRSVCSPPRFNQSSVVFLVVRIFFLRGYIQLRRIPFGIAHSRVVDRLGSFGCGESGMFFIKEWIVRNAASDYPVRSRLQDMSPFKCHGERRIYSFPKFY